MQGEIVNQFIQDFEAIGQQTNSFNGNNSNENSPIKRISNAKVEIQDQYVQVEAQEMTEHCSQTDTK